MQSEYIVSKLIVDTWWSYAEGRSLAVYRKSDGKFIPLGSVPDAETSEYFWEVRHLGHQEPYVIVTAARFSQDPEESWMISIHWIFKEKDNGSGITTKKIATEIQDILLASGALCKFCPIS